VNAIFPGPLCHWFIADLARKIVETAQTLFNHCLTPQCTTTSFRRAKALMRIISLVQLSTLPGNERIFGNLPGQLVQLRLDGALSLEGSVIDPALTKLFDNQVTIPSRARLHKSLQLLSVERWDSTNKELRVVSSPFLVLKLEFDAFYRPWRPHTSTAVYLKQMKRLSK
jgi:serine/threonine-protein kinase ATR